MMIFLTIILPLAIFVTVKYCGGAGGRFSSGTLLTGLILLPGGFVVGLIGDTVHRETYNEQFAMGPISEAGLISIVGGILLIFLGAVFILVSGLFRGVSRRPESRTSV